MKFRITPFLQPTGILLIVYSLIREAFGGGIPTRTFDAHTQPTALQEYVAQAQEIALHIGGKIGLVPTEHALTAMEHRTDAMLAIFGFLFLVVVALINIVQTIRRK